MRVEKTVFICYRRANYYTALSVYKELEKHGYDVFLDYRSINSGDWREVIRAEIAARAHFLIILTPSALERCINPDDVMRMEIERAIELKRNIVPLMFDGFNFSDAEKYLSPRMNVLPSYNGQNVPDEFFDEAMLKVRKKIDIALEMILHPVMPQIAALVAEVQAETVATDAPTDAQREAEAWFERGFKSGKTQNMDKAIKEFTEAIRLNPKYALAYLYRGMTYSKKGDPIKALEEFNSAIILDPKLDHAYNMRGWEYSGTKNIDKALDDFNEAIRLNPRNTFAYVGRGWVYLDSNDLEKAINDFELALQIDPENEHAKPGLKLARQQQTKQF